LKSAFIFSIIYIMKAFARLSAVLFLLSAFLSAASTSEKEFLSVKGAKVSVRENPEGKAKALWTMWKYSPAEVVSFRGDWVRIRDFEGDTGWLKKTDLAAVETVAVVKKEGRLREKPDAKAKVLWILDKGYSLRVFGADGEWLEVSDLDDASGWIRRDEVWGAPPPERAPRP
jgi:SH3-like domain-containing protein